MEVKKSANDVAKRCLRTVGKVSVCALAAFSVLASGGESLHAQNDYWYQRVSLFDKLPIRPGDIVFLGNSITDGGEFQELFGREDVKNRGIVSDVISGVRKRLDQVTVGNPAAIFLLIGINDVSHGKSAGKIAADYEILVREIREKSPQTRLYVQSVLPINNDFKRYKNLLGREEVVPALNSLLKQIAERNGAVYVDLWPAFADASTGKLRRELTNDGLHLSGEGYKVWASELMPYVSTMQINSDTYHEEK